MFPESAAASARRTWSLASRLAAQPGLSAAQQQRWRRASQAIPPVLLAWALGLMAMARWTDWDLRLADRAYDATLRVFPLRHAWLTETFNHVILKQVFTALALLLAAAVLWDLALPRRWSWLRRYQMRVIALSAALVPLTISLLKQASDSHCPWDLARYGGTAPYASLFERLPAGIAPGHCLPGGHASSALWMMAFCVLFIPHRLPAAGRVLGLFLMLGIGVGWGQQLRGAHFLSHTLWSAWIAALLIFAIIICLDRWPRRA